MTVRTLSRIGLATALSLLSVAPTAGAEAGTINSFVRVATYDVVGEVAEIVAVSVDGRTLVYTDSETGEIGFVDISNPSRPVAAGTIAVDGSPTAVTVVGDHVLAVIDTSPSFIAPSGRLLVIDLVTRTTVADRPLAGQPDSIAASPDGHYAAIALENQRDEDFNDGALPQDPPGALAIVDLAGPATSWTVREPYVSFVGLPGLFEASDPEPEFIDISPSNVAAVTLQENNAIAMVDLTDGTVIDSWSAGSATHVADLLDNRAVSFSQTLTEEREPDAIGWTPDGRLVTANEGDLRGGSRDFTIFEADGTVAWTAGGSLEQVAAQYSHYPDDRSDAKGVEPEGVEIGRYGNRTYAFIGAERGAFVAVYRIDREISPTFVQLLPTGLKPEGLLAIPSRNLFVTANEDDGTISIFAGRTQSAEAPGAYPDVIAAEPGIDWAALSGLAALADRPLVGVVDSIRRPARILTLEDGQRIEVTGSVSVSFGGTPMNYDLEGITHRPQGGYWAVAEGGASAATLPNLLLQIGVDGAVVGPEIHLPAAVEAQQRQFGFEGVATTADGSQVFVAFQREWVGDPAGLVRIGRYTVATGAWAFYHYPLEAAPSGGWVGLSEIVRVDDSTFAVIERDNQAAPDALVKQIRTFSVAGLTPAPVGSAPPLVSKTLIRDLIATDGVRLEKWEGMAILPNGKVLVASDNDGSGETDVLRPGRLFN